MLSLVIIKSLKIKISLNESVKDRTRCPAIQGFVRSIPNFDRTLSVDRPLFAALLCKSLAKILEGNQTEFSFRLLNQSQVSRCLIKYCEHINCENSSNQLISSDRCEL